MISSYKVKYISQVNVGLIWNLRIRFFQISWLDCEQHGKNQYKQKEHNRQLSVHSVMIMFILFKCHRFIDNSTDFLSFYLVVKRLVIAENLVMKIQNLVNYKSWLVKSNSVVLIFILNFHSLRCDLNQAITFF